jgi:hypothetical protein
MMPMSSIMKWLLISSVLLLFCTHSQAQTINAASCSQTDVQDAFNAVTASTKTINIPAGTCHWTTQVSLSVPSGSSTLSVLGAGSQTVTGGGDATVLIDDYSGGKPILQFSTAAASSQFRLAGITIKGGSGAVTYTGMLAIYGNSQNVRIDHCHTDTSTFNPGNASLAIQFSGWIYGVVDHCIIDTTLSGVVVNNGIHVDMGSYGGHSFGDGSWADDTSLGSNKFVYMENNVFNGGFTNDCGDGGRFVMRFNTINAASTQMHVTGGGGRVRGCRAWEMYGNTLFGSNSNPNPPGQVFWIDSGTGVMWGNSAPTGYNSLIQMLTMRRNNNTYSQGATPGGWGYCGTSFNGTGSNWDQNANASTGFTCLDQVGVGKGDLLANDFPNVTNTATSCTASSACAWPRQAREPFYEWMDTFASIPNSGKSAFAIQESDVNTENSTYFVGGSSFNGSLSCASAPHCGTGYGTLASRPATCTTGVAYWATDQGNWNTSGNGGEGILYKCTATNTWTAFYTPYNYPHPLVSGQQASGGSVAPPTSLLATVQ